MREEEYEAALILELAEGTEQAWQVRGYLNHKSKGVPWNPKGNDLRQESSSFDVHKTATFTRSNQCQCAMHKEMAHASSRPILNIRIARAHKGKSGSRNYLHLAARSARRHGLQE